MGHVTCDVQWTKGIDFVLGLVGFVLTTAGHNLNIAENEKDNDPVGVGDNDPSLDTRPIPSDPFIHFYSVSFLKEVIKIDCCPPPSKPLPGWKFSCFLCVCVCVGGLILDRRLLKTSHLFHANYNEAR